MPLPTPIFEFKAPNIVCRLGYWQANDVEFKVFKSEKGEIRFLTSWFYGGGKSRESTSAWSTGMIKEGGDTLYDMSVSGVMAEFPLEGLSPRDIFLKVMRSRIERFELIHYPGERTAKLRKLFEKLAMKIESNFPPEVEEFTRKLIFPAERSDIHDILGYDESILSERPEDENWVPFRKEEFDRLKPGQEVVINFGPQAVHPYIEAIFCYHDKDSIPDNDYGVVKEKESSSSFSNPWTTFGRWKSFERSDIHDILGYDESILSENTFSIETPWGEDLVSALRSEPKLKDYPFCVSTGGSEIQVTWNGEDCNLCLKFYRDGYSVGEMHRNPVFRISVGVPGAKKSRGRSFIPSDRRNKTYSFTEVPTALTGTFTDILTPEQAGRAGEAYRTIIGVFYAPERGDIHDITGYDEALQFDEFGNWLTESLPPYESVFKHGYDESVLGEYSEDENWRPLTRQEFDNLKLGEEVVVNCGPNVANEYVEMVFLKHDKDAIPDNDYAKVAEKGLRGAGKSYFMPWTSLGRFKTPERSDIHDIIGYDESVLVESKYQVGDRIRWTNRRSNGETEVDEFRITAISDYGYVGVWALSGDEREYMRSTIDKDEAGVLVPPPERSDIHDIIGYDEALLREFSGTASIAVGIGSSLPTKKAKKKRKKSPIDNVVVAEPEKLS
jgi:hypothetical protein